MTVMVNGEWNGVATMWGELVPEYKSRSYRPLMGKVRMSDDDWTICRRLGKLSTVRAQRRWASYIDEDELTRCGERGSDWAMRCGVSKTGHGYHGGRGDFCLAAVVWQKDELTLMWRSLELIGGLCYDLWLMGELCRRLELRPRRVNLYACSANVFALRRNSNEKLWPRMRRIMAL